MIYGILYVLGGLVTLLIAAYFLWRQLISFRAKRRN